MLRLRDIMTTDVVTVSPDLSVRDAMELLSARHLSGAPVVSGTKVVGVVSLTDLAGLAAAEPAAPPVEGPEWNVLAERTVGEAMNRTICALSPTTLVDHAAQFMRDAEIHRVLVMDGERLLGLVTTRDIADAVGDHKLTAQTYVFGPKADDRGW